MEHNDAMDFAFQNIDLPMLSISDEGALCGVFRLNEQSGWIVKRKEADIDYSIGTRPIEAYWKVESYG